MRTDLFMNQEDQLNQEILNYLHRKFTSIISLIYLQV